MTVTERDATGVALSSFEATAVSLQGENRVRGITFDGTNLWVVGAYDSKVACYSTAGALVSSFIGDGGEQSDTGVAWDGSHLWASGLNLDQLRRYTTGGSHSSSVSCPDPGAMAVYDSTLYVIDPAGQQLRTFSLAGAEGTPVDISDAPINPTGVWIAADGTLYLSLDGVGVYRRLTAL